jgi:hypothetical protein
MPRRLSRPADPGTRRMTPIPLAAPHPVEPVGPEHPSGVLAGRSGPAAPGSNLQAASMMSPTPYDRPRRNPRPSRSWSFATTAGKLCFPMSGRGLRADERPGSPPPTARQRQPARDTARCGACSPPGPGLPSVCGRGGRVRKQSFRAGVAKLELRDESPTPVSPLRLGCGGHPVPAAEALSDLGHHGHDVLVLPAAQPAPMDGETQV